MCDKSFVFQNPENLPVEKLKLSVENDGIVRQVNALDPFWVEPRVMILYALPPSGDALVFGAVEAWKARMDIYCEGLRWLLSLEHHRFWSTILYHPRCTDSLVSFLQEGDPPYLPPHDCKTIQSLYAEIRRHILVIYSRLCTNKEDPSRWMSKEYMAEMMYNHFVFSVPIIWDICLVYGTDNGQHVARLVTSVLTLQPKYLQDIRAAMEFVNEAFKYIILQVNKDYDCTEPPNLPETFQGFSDIKREQTNIQLDKLTFSLLKDLILHMLDTAMTLRIFIQSYPKGVEIFRETNVIISMVQLYEYGIPNLYVKLQELSDEDCYDADMEGYIEVARAEMIDMFRDILAVYKNDILNGEGNIASHVESYLSVLMDGLSERLLIRDYNSCYPVHEDLDMLRQVYPLIDSVKTDFILQAIYSNIEDLIPEPILEQVTTNVLQDTLLHNIEPEPGPSMDNACALDPDIPEPVREESAISEVKSILPHLGEGFILQCLKHYKFETETVVSRILDGNLDPALRDLDQTLPIIPDDPLDTKFLETGVARLNVFDGDEFDIMTRDDVDMSRIHRGKRKDRYRDAKELLDDKTEVRRLADLYSKYSLVQDTYNMYSDEYDDTYDTEGIPPPSADPTDDVRPFVTPRALRQIDAQDRNEVESSSSEEDQPTQSTSGPRDRMDFCVNPEEARARREAAYQARHGRGRGAVPKDVQGKPRGQGQEKEVLVNRERKEKHKSSRANHNRRQGASWKRSQGMMPS